MSFSCYLVRALRRIFTVLLGFAAFCLSCCSVVMLAKSVRYLRSEPIYEISLKEHNPRYDGCLVRAHVTQIRSGTESAMENYFDLPVPGSVLVASRLSGDRDCMPDNVRDVARLMGTYAAPQVLAGVFELTGMEPEAYGGNNWQPADASIVRLMPGLKTLAKTVTPDGIELSPAEQPGKPYRISFQYAPSPHKVNCYIIARQQGLRLVVQDLLRGEEAFRHATRVKTPPVMSVGDFLLRTCCCVVLCIVSIAAYIRLGNIRLLPVRYYLEHPVQLRVFQGISFALTIIMWAVTCSLLFGVLTSTRITVSAVCAVCQLWLATALMTGAASAYSSLNVEKARFDGLCAVPLIGISCLFFVIFGSMHRETPYLELGLMVLLGVCIPLLIGMLYWRKRQLRRAE